MQHLKPTNPRVGAVVAKIEAAPPGQIVVYHEGPAGSLPPSLAEAVRAMLKAGKCTLAQRPSGRSDQWGRRIWQWVAVRTS